MRADRGGPISPPVDEAPWDERDQLRRALALIECDLTRTFRRSVRLIVEEHYVDEDEPALFITGDPESGLSMQMEVAVDEVVTIARLAEAIQESCLFEDYEYSWPVCPFHPGKKHSLQPKRVGRAAAWVCPESDTKVCCIGQYGL